ncbi:8-oxoguanine DNA glycosylase OGG fold protein [Mycolicibacterium sp. Dal123E01]|uniref:8-oxoguanine DNA glycosylase OGG fold protein n=1 Tax=Mycolicibacterium sp. Dal123E01 TaxID=3457578 RepID=UPI00403EE78A
MTDTGEERAYDNWAKYRSEWWTKYFTDDLAHFWPPQLDQPEPDKGNYRWVSRNEVFTIAASDSEHRELHTAVAAYVWGLGKNAYSVGRSVRAFTTNADTVENNLRSAALILARDGAVAAYESMLRGGSAQTKFIGPAYFTKFLFFMGYRNPAVTGLRPLILDKRVATALRERGVFGPKAGDGDWPSNLYERYLTYCLEQNPGDPETVEAELFMAGRAAD